MDPILPGVLNGDVEPGGSRLRQVVGRGGRDASAGTVSGIAGIQVAVLMPVGLACRLGTALPQTMVPSPPRGVPPLRVVNRFRTVAIVPNPHVFVHGSTIFSSRLSVTPAVPAGAYIAFPAPPRCRARCSDAHRTKRPWA